MQELSCACVQGYRVKHPFIWEIVGYLGNPYDPVYVQLREAFHSKMWFPNQIVSDLHKLPSDFIIERIGNVLSTETNSHGPWMQLKVTLNRSSTLLKFHKIYQFSKWFITVISFSDFFQLPFAPRNSQLSRGAAPWLDCCDWSDHEDRWHPVEAEKKPMPGG